MIISKTPYRISLFGGGTDYPEWFEENGGAVVGGAIDKFCYIACRPLPPFFDHTHRIVYSRIELIDAIDSIQHPAVRESMRLTGIDKGVEISHVGDLPAHSGIGSSSSFTVGLLNAIWTLQSVAVDPHKLTVSAIHVERDLAKEVVGYQDQAFAAYGGFNHIQFGPGKNFVVNQLNLPQERLSALEQSLMLFYTGQSRLSTQVAASYIIMMDKRKTEMQRTMEIVSEALNILNNGNLLDIGPLMHESWLIKQQRGTSVSNDHLNTIYKKALRLGALGGKIVGAGGAGFLLLVVPPEVQNTVRVGLNDLIHVPFKFCGSGSQIVANTGVIWD